MHGTTTDKSPKWRQVWEASRRLPTAGCNSPCLLLTPLFQLFNGASYQSMTKLSFLLQYVNSTTTPYSVLRLALGSLSSWWLLTQPLFPRTALPHFIQDLQEIRSLVKLYLSTFVFYGAEHCKSHHGISSGITSCTMLTIYPVLQSPSTGKRQAFYNLRRIKYSCEVRKTSGEENQAQFCQKDIQSKQPAGHTHTWSSCIVLKNTLWIANERDQQFK